MIILHNGMALMNVRDKGDMEKSNARMAWAAAFAVVVYILVGVFFFSKVESALYPGKTATGIDGLYFTVVTMMTVGYGDMGPTGQGPRLFTVFFVLLGMSFI